MQVIDGLGLVVYYSRNPFKGVSLGSTTERKNGSRTNRQTCRENLTNESKTNLGILQQFSTMTLPIVVSKRRNIWFQRVSKHSIERKKSPKRVPRTSMSYCRWKKSCTSWCGSFFPLFTRWCRILSINSIVNGSDFCLTTYLGNLLLQGLEHKSQIVCSFRISEPSPVCIQSISICQDLDQFLKVKHLARHMWTPRSFT